VVITALFSVFWKRLWNWPWNNNPEIRGWLEDFVDLVDFVDVLDRWGTLNWNLIPRVRKFESKFCFWSGITLIAALGLLFMYFRRRLLESRRLTWRIFSNYREQNLHEDNLQFAEWETIFQITNLIFLRSGVAEIKTLKLQCNRTNNMASIKSCTLLVVTYRTMN